MREDNERNRKESEIFPLILVFAHHFLDGGQSLKWKKFGREKED